MEAILTGIKRLLLPIDRTKISQPRPIYINVKDYKPPRKGALRKSYF